MQSLNKLLRILLPQLIRLNPSRQYPLLTIRDHLVRDLHKKAGHFLFRVVEPGDRVDHLDCVHEGLKGVDYLLGGADVERLDEFLEG